jgi:hypothetical protein
LLMEEGRKKCTAPPMTILSWIHIGEGSTFRPFLYAKHNKFFFNFFNLNNFKENDSLVCNFQAVKVPSQLPKVTSTCPSQPKSNFHLSKFLLQRCPWNWFSSRRWGKKKEKKGCSALRVQMELAEQSVQPPGKRDVLVEGRLKQAHVTWERLNWEEVHFWALHLYWCTSTGYLIV